MVIGLCMALMTRLGANLFFRTIAGGAASALAAVALTRLGVGQNQDLIIIGALMALVPGIAMTNAMRDIMAGDMVAGISRRRRRCSSARPSLWAPPWPWA